MLKASAALLQELLQPIFLLLSKLTVSRKRLYQIQLPKRLPPLRTREFCWNCVGRMDRFRPWILEGRICTVVQSGRVEVRDAPGSDVNAYDYYSRRLLIFGHLD